MPAPPVTALAGKVTFPELGALIIMRSCLLALIPHRRILPLQLYAADIAVWCDRSYFLASLVNNMIQFWAGDYREMPTRDQRTEMRCIFRLFRRQMSLLLSIITALLHDRYVVMIVAFCLYNIFPLAVCSVILCVLLRQSPPRSSCSGLYPVVGRRMP